MYRLSIILAALLVPTPSVAAQSDWKDACEAASTLAEQIMKARQNGVPMAAQMNMTKAEPNDLVEALIIDAYDKPRFESDKHQMRLIEDFRDEAYLKCAKTMRTK